MSALFPELRRVNPHYAERAGLGVNINCGLACDTVSLRLQGINLTTFVDNTGYRTYREIMSTLVGVEHGMTFETCTGQAKPDAFI